MQVDLVHATAVDLPRLHEWMRQLRSVDPMKSGQFVPAAAIHQAIEQLIHDPSAGRVWAIHADHQPAGYIALVFGFSIEFGGRIAFIDELFIEEPLQGRGIGKQAIEQVINISKNLNVRNLLLEVSEQNQRAMRLYTRCGFSPRKYQLMTRWLNPME